MEENQTENTQKSGGKGIYLAIIALLLLVSGGLGYMLFTTNNDKKDLEVAKQEVDNQYQGVLTELEARNAELEQYKGQNAELDSIIEERQAEIEKYKGEIETLLKKGKFSAAELTKARGIIEKLKEENKELQGKIEELTQANEQLTQENQELGKSLEEEKKVKESLTVEKQDLSKKVELGSLLKLSNLSVVGIQVKNNGKESETNKLKKVNKLKISFETGENRITEKGNLKLYVRVINPKGETIAVRDQGSGTFKLADNRNDVQYSRIADVNYQQGNKKVSIDWGSNINMAGTYKVEVYQSGYLIGKGETQLK